MIVAYHEITPNKAVVETIIYDESITPIPQKSVHVSSLPVREIPPRGKGTTLYIDPLTKKVWYELYDRPLTLEEQTDELKSQNAQIILALVMNDLM